jgi:hypothetical protein
MARRIVKNERLANLFLKKIHQFVLIRCRVTSETYLLDSFG